MAEWLSLLEFHGRLSRIGFWRAYLKLAIGVSVIWLVGLFAGLAIGIWAAPLFLPLIPLLIANVAIVVRRAHDRGRSALWAGAVLVLPSAIIGAASLLRLRPLGVAILLFAIVVAFAINILGLVEVCLLGSSPRAGRFGPVPAVN